MLFIFAIKNENEVFIKYALQETIFSLSMLTNSEIIEEILKTLESGARIELCFNILIYTDFSRWRRRDIDRLFEF